MPHSYLYEHASKQYHHEPYRSILKKTWDFFKICSDTSMTSDNQKSGIIKIKNPLQNRTPKNVRIKFNIQKDDDRGVQDKTSGEDDDINYCRIHEITTEYLKLQSGNTKNISCMSVLPNRKKFPNYYRVVERPMSFSCIGEKVKKNMYMCLDDLLSDYKIIFDNYVAYDRSDLLTRDDAESLKRKVVMFFKGVENDDAFSLEDIRSLFGNIIDNDIEGFHHAISLLKIVRVDFPFFYCYKHEVYKWNFLHCSAFMGFVDFVVSIMDCYKIDVDSLDYIHGGTSLGWSSYSGNYHASKLLITRYNADISKPNRYGFYPIDLYKPDKNKNVRLWKKMLSLSVVKSEALLLRHKIELIIDEIVALKVRDEEGVEVCASELFMELPSREQYPDYYEVINNPICINSIIDKIQSYSNIDSFCCDIENMVDNAKTYNEPDSMLYSNAVEIENLVVKFTGISSNRSEKIVNIGGLSFHFRSQQEICDLREKSDVFAYHMNGISLEVGEFVHVKEDRSDRDMILCVHYIWKHESGHMFISGCRYFYPEEISQNVGVEFRERELIKGQGVCDCLMTSVSKKCYVLYVTDYQKGCPEGSSVDDVFLCEFEYDEVDKSLNPIKDWKKTSKSVKYELVPWKVIPSINENLDFVRSDKVGSEEKSSEICSIKLKVNLKDASSTHRPSDIQNTHEDSSKIGDVSPSSIGRDCSSQSKLAKYDMSVKSPSTINLSEPNTKKHLGRIKETLESRPISGIESLNFGPLSNEHEEKFAYHLTQISLSYDDRCQMVPNNNNRYVVPSCRMKSRIDMLDHIHLSSFYLENQFYNQISMYDQSFNHVVETFSTTGIQTLNVPLFVDNLYCNIHLKPQIEEEGDCSVLLYNNMTRVLKTSNTTIANDKKMRVNAEFMPDESRGGQETKITKDVSKIRKISAPFFSVKLTRGINIIEIFILKNRHDVKVVRAIEDMKILYSFLIYK